MGIRERSKRNFLIRTLSTASLISPCPGFESGTLSKASLPLPLLTGYLSDRNRLGFASSVAGFRHRSDCLCPTNQNSEAVAKEIGAPASGITATRWQVLTPRTKISYPVLGLERIASPSLKLAQTCQHTQAKLIHLFTIIHNGALLSCSFLLQCVPVGSECGRGKPCPVAHEAAAIQREQTKDQSLGGGRPSRGPQRSANLPGPPGAPENRRRGLRW